MCIQSLKPHVPLSWRIPEHTGLSLPGCLNVTQRCETPLGTQVSTPISHSGPHDLWGHRPNISPRPPLPILFFLQSFRGKGLPSLFSDSSLREELKGPAHSFNSNQLRGGELQLPAHLTKETSSKPKFYNLWAGTRCPAGELQPATELQSPTEPRRHEPHYQQDDFTELRTAQQTLLPFPRTGNKTGLINTYTRLSKTVCSIMCDVFKFDWWCCDILVISYLKVM